VPGSFKAEAVILRSIRFGEADRVLHLYTRERGRVGAVAKGVRRVRSRFGGRLEPLFRVNLVLHEGRGELCTVTAAETVHAHGALRDRRQSLERGTQACEAVLRLLDSGEPNQPAYNLLCRELALLVAAGFVPELTTCAMCGDREHLAAFSAGAGGVVCAACEAGSFPLDPEAHEFLVLALARPLSEVSAAPERALAQADRAIAETLEYHAHIRLRRVA
jgi:DNA repair protein RecO (recombination protein O)